MIDPHTSTPNLKLFKRMLLSHMSIVTCHIKAPTEDSPKRDLLDEDWHQTVSLLADTDTLLERRGNDGR